MTTFPVFGSRMFDKFIKGLQNKSFKLKPEWGFEPAQVTPIVSDELINCLENGLISSTKGIKRIIGDTEIETDDGKRIDVDVLIWCTGYKADFSMLETRFDPTYRAVAAWSQASGSNGKPLARLYHNVFSLEKPDSLAFLGNVHTTLSGFQLFDMASMAIAQVWKGASTLPSRDAMADAVDKHHVWITEQAKRRSNVSPGMVDGGTWLHDFDEMAGTGVNEHLGWGWQGWWFWLTNKKLCNMLVGGIWSPHTHRFFEGKRKRWDGAKAAIEHVNCAGPAAAKSKST